MMVPVDELMEEILKENSWRFAEAVKDEIIEQIIEVVLEELDVQTCVDTIKKKVRQRAKCR